MIDKILKNPKYIEAFKDITNEHGREKQFAKTAEELAELIQVLMKWNTNKNMPVKFAQDVGEFLDWHESLNEEIADVLICVAYCIWANADKFMIRGIIKDKMKRIMPDHLIDTEGE
jgi:NTP pyrophosphatase (non-canonical NTP hydrolase)